MKQFTGMSITLTTHILYMKCTFHGQWSGQKGEVSVTSTCVIQHFSWLYWQ